MTLTISDTTMTSDQVPVTAEFCEGAAANGNGAWVVSWLSGLLLDYNQAITAMTLAEYVDAHIGDRPLEFDPQVEAWAAELGLTVDDAVAKIAAAMLSNEVVTDG